MSSELALEALESRAERRSERREFFRTALGAAAVGAAGVSMLSLGGAARAQALTDADVLNFALNLEYLEANFYHYAVFGTPIPTDLTDGMGNHAAATGGRAVNFKDSAVRGYAKEIAGDELAHVRFLRGALGDAKVAQPRIDVGTAPGGAFSSAAVAAGLIQPGQSFDPYMSDETFLLGSYIFEDVGVTAYKGAAPLISNKTYLEAAAGILAAEAYHASIIRTSLYAKGLNMPMLRTAANRISDARDSLDGPMDLDQGISGFEGRYGYESNIVPLDGDGIAFSRPAGSVLNIVYLTPTAASMGGFFPEGVNGTIATSTAQPGSGQ